MSCDNNKNRKAQNKDAVNKAKASLDEATSALAEATKQEKDTEKKHADAEAGFIMFIVSSPPQGSCPSAVSLLRRWPNTVCSAYYSVTLYQ